MALSEEINRPAFPQEGAATAFSGGLTKLEYFAAAALTGLLANQDPRSHLEYKDIASNAVALAFETLRKLSA